MDYSPKTFSEELISAYLDGELTADEQASVEQTLAANADFRQMADELRMLREGLKSLPRYQLPSDFSDQVLGRLTESRMSPDASVDNAMKQRPRRNLLMTIGALAAVAAAVLIAALSFPGLWEADTTVAINDEERPRATGDSRDIPIERDGTEQAVVEPDAARASSRSRMAAALPAVDRGLDYVIHVDLPENAGGWQDFDKSLQQLEVPLAETPKRIAHYDDMIQVIRDHVQLDFDDARISPSYGSRDKLARMIFVEAKRRQIDAIRAQFRNQQYRVEAATQVPGTPPQQFVDDLKKNAGEVRRLVLGDQPAVPTGFAFRLIPGDRPVERQTSDSLPPTSGQTADSLPDRMTSSRQHLGAMLVRDANGVAAESPQDSNDDEVVRVLFLLERPIPELLTSPAAPSPDLPSADKGSDQ